MMNVWSYHAACLLATALAILLALISAGESAAEAKAEKKERASKREVEYNIVVGRELAGDCGYESKV